jgi:Dolichyl-phosphate-mannose-protein mannosyltransferase
MISRSSLDLRSSINAVSKQALPQGAPGNTAVLDSVSPLGVPSEGEPQVSSLPMLLWAVAIALFIRLMVVALVYKQFLDPGRDHWECGYEIGRVARAILAGHGFANPYWANTGPTAILTPVSPYFFAAVFWIFGASTKASALVILASNCLVSALTCLPIYFGALLCFGARTAKWAAWAWAFFPYAINFSADTMWYHSFVGLLLALLFWIGLRLESSDRVLAWAGFGVLFGFSALTNPVILDIAPFFGAWVCYRLARNGRRWARAATAGSLALVITIAPWLVRNDRAFHSPVFLKDNFWMEFCVGNVGNALHWWNGDIHPSGSAAEMRRFGRLGEMSYMAQKREQAFAFLENSSQIYVIRTIRRVVYMWTGYWSFDREYLREEPLDRENIVFLTSFTLLSLIGLSKAFRANPQVAAPFLIVLLIYPGPYYLTHPDPGFRHPMDPLLVILSCFAFTSWFPSHRKAAVTTRYRFFVRAAPVDSSRLYPVLPR